MVCLCNTFNSIEILMLLHVTWYTCVAFTIRTLIQFQGYCTEYNIVGAVIQPHSNLKCSKVTPPCVNHYNSTDAYRCELKTEFI